MGKLGEMILSNGFMRVERIFDLKEYSEEKKVKLVAIKLRGYASYWWKNVKRRREREGRNQIRQWTKMKRELKGRFLTDTYKQENYLRLYNFRQGELSVEKYTREFEFLKLKCDVREPEEQTIARYLGGLQKNIADVVRLQPYWVFNDVQKLAINVEQQQREAMKSTFEKTKFFKGNSSTSGSSFNKDGPYKSVEKGKQPVELPNMKRKCFKCQGYGHLQADCPNKRIITINGVVEEEGEDEEEASKYDEYEEFEECADEGEMLIMRRSLHSDTTKDELWLRESLFHTRCTSHGKACSVIIDSGSCTNAVSEEMVTKLGLQTEPHPRPYQIQ